MNLGLKGTETLAAFYKMDGFLEYVKEARVGIGHYLFLLIIETNKL